MEDIDKKKKSSLRITKNNVTCLHKIEFSHIIIYETKTFVY